MHMHSVHAHVHRVHAHVYKVHAHAHVPNGKSGPEAPATLTMQPPGACASLPVQSMVIDVLPPSTLTPKGLMGWSCPAHEKWPTNSSCREPLQCTTLLSSFALGATRVTAKLNGCRSVFSSGTKAWSNSCWLESERSRASDWEAGVPPIQPRSTRRPLTATYGEGGGEGGSEG